MAEGDRLGGRERKPSAEGELVARAHGERSNGELGGLVRLNEYGHALASLWLEAERRLQGKSSTRIGSMTRRADWSRRMKPRGCARGSAVA